MENDNKLTKDALRLAQGINESILPEDKFAIINIGKSEKKNIVFPEIPSIPTGFSYVYDKVPEIFEKNKIIEAKIKGRWFTEISELPYLEDFFGDISNERDLITQTAREKGYISQHLRASFYKWFKNRLTSKEYNYGPVLPGQFSVLINVRNLRNFIGISEGLIPIYSSEDKKLHYKGKELQFNGGVEDKFIEILIKNHNCIVSKENICRFVYPDKDYLKNKTFVDDSIKSTFKRVKRKFGEDTFFEESFLLTEKKGFGIFIIQNQIRQ